ncbi:MAG: site-specific integrase [Bryobacteraceae bacterium]
MSGPLECFLFIIVRASPGRQRIIPLSGEVVRALAGVMERSPFKADDDLVFHRQLVAHRDRNLARRHLKPAGKRIGCDWVSWHCFRRTWATLADQLDLEISDRQSTMGHGDFRMTLHYTQKALSRRRVAIERITEGILTANDNSGNNEGNVQPADFNGRGGVIRTRDPLRPREGDTLPSDDLPTTWPGKRR